MSKTPPFPLRPLANLCDPTSTWNPAREPRDEIVYIDVSAVSSERSKITAPQRVKAEKAPSRARKLVRAGDTLFATIRPSLSRIALVPKELDGQIASTAFCIIRPKPVELDSQYAYYAVQSDDFISSVVVHEAGASYPAVRDDQVLEQDIPCPPLPEQREIATTLERVQAAMEIETERLRVARELKQAALAEVFTRGLRGEGQRETAYGLVPKSWTDRQLSGCSYVQTGVAKNSRNVSADALEVPYLRVANVQDGHLDLSEMKTIRIPEREIESCLLRDGDVVLTEGGDFDKLGRGFVWEGQIPRCVHQNHVFAVRTDRDQLDPFFFAYLAQSSYGKAYFLSVAHKTTNLACINTTKLRAFPVILPLFDEQREIGDLFRGIDARIARHEARQKLLRELFSSLLRDLMTGRRRVGVEKKKASGGS